MTTKTILRQSMGIALFSTSLVLGNYQTVHADELSKNPSLATTNLSSDDSNLAPLDAAITKASQAGVLVVESQPVAFDRFEDAEKDAKHQIGMLEQARQEALIDQSNYLKDQQAYQTYLKDQAAYEQASRDYEAYLGELAAYRKAYTTYQEQENAYQQILVENRQSQDHHQEALKKYDHDFKQYHDKLKAFEQGQLSNEVLKQEYEAAQLAYERDLLAYQEQEKKQQQAKQAQIQAQSAYQKALEGYQVELKTYQVAKARYDEQVAEAQGKIGQFGYLSEVVAQNLIFRSEPNTTQTFTGKYLSPQQLATLSKNGMGWLDPGTLTTPVSQTTIRNKGQWNAAYMRVGDTVQVDYSGLENASFSGNKLKRVRYTYTLLSSTHYDQSVILQAISDPTVTAYAHVYNKDDKTTASFEMEMRVQFFDANDQEIIPTPSQYALTSFASINSFNASGEYVAGYNGQLLPITGSTITVQNGRAMNHSNIRQESVAPDWDHANSPDAYIGAIVGKSTGPIRFTFGNSDGFAYWFAFNSDVKAKGVLGPEPIAPVKPELLQIALPDLGPAPQKPTKPQYGTLEKPLAPQKPQAPSLKTAIKPSVPIAPISVKNPIQPKVVKAPSLPELIVLVFHRSFYRPKPSNNQSLSTPKPQPVSSQERTSAPITVTVQTHQPSPALNYPVIATNGLAGLPLLTSPWSPQRPPLRISPELIPVYTRQQVPTDSQAQHFRDNLTIKASDNSSGLENAKATLAYIDAVTKTLKQKHRGNQTKVDRDLALLLSKKVYGTDRLQKLLNNFSNVNTPNHISQIIQKNHDNNNADIDFAHVMTTLASLENQKGHMTEMMKGVFSVRLPVFNLSWKDLLLNKALLKNKQLLRISWQRFWRELALRPVLGAYDRQNILQLNSLVGDFLTTNSQKDIYSDMDAIILSQHPRYRKLPLNGRIKAYYGQKDLTKKRQSLFLESYHKDQKLSKTAATLDLLVPLATLGGLAALAFGLGKYKGSSKPIAKNLALTDQIALKGTLHQWQKQPLKAVKEIAILKFSKNIQPIATASKLIAKKTHQTIKQVSGVIKKTVSKVLQPITKSPQPTQAPKPVSRPVYQPPAQVQPLRPSTRPQSAPKPTAAPARPQPTPASPPKPASIIKQVSKAVIAPVVKVAKTVIKNITKVFHKAPKKKGRRR